ncbi:MAG: hypothetical protein QQN63_03135 [Nitrosopumilus sp.]
MRDIPVELRGLWKLQYQPLEKILQEAVDSRGNEESIEKAHEYKKSQLFSKISLLDKLHEAHFA